MAREWQPQPEKRPGGFARGPSEAPSPSVGTMGPELTATGTGFIVSRRGHVLTNAHVVDGCREIRIVWSAKDRLSSPVLAVDRQNDLARPPNGVFEHPFHVFGHFRLVGGESRHFPRRLPFA